MSTSLYIRMKPNFLKLRCLKPTYETCETLLEFVRHQLPSYRHKLPTHMALHKTPNAMKYNLQYSRTLVRRV